MPVITTPNKDDSLYLYIIGVAHVGIQSAYPLLPLIQSSTRFARRCGLLLWVVHLASQGGTPDNMQGEMTAKA
jgi:hypothetical protein